MQGQGIIESGFFKVLDYLNQVFKSELFDDFKEDGHIRWVMKWNVE